jgi:hypothetical protein
MTNTPLIISPKDESSTVMTTERHVLNLKYTAFDHTVGKLRVLGTWYLDRYVEPCLVIVRADRPIQSQTPCVVLLASAYKWAEETGHEIEAAVMATAFADTLGLDAMREKDVFLVLDTVRGRLQDLIHMPEAPTMDRRLAGEALALTTDGRTIAREIYEND